MRKWIVGGLLWVAYGGWYCWVAVQNPPVTLGEPPDLAIEATPLFVPTQVEQEEAVWRLIRAMRKDWTTYDFLNGRIDDE